MNRFKVNFLEGPIIQSICIFAIPILISNIFQQLYNTVDTMIVGNVLGEQSLAAIGASSAIYDLFVGFSLGVGNGLSIVIAREYGSNNQSLLKKSIAGTIVIGLLLCITITIIIQVALPTLLTILNTPQNVYTEAYAYISTITQFVTVMFSYNICAGIMRAIGDSVIPLIFLIIASFTNVVLDIVCVVYLHLGVQGAAIATVISQACSAVLCMLYIGKKCRYIVPTKAGFHVDKAMYIELLSQGFSMGCMLSIVSLGTAILQSAINGSGYLTIAAHTTARKISAFACMPCSTIASALSVFVSQNKGAKQIDRIQIALKKTNYLVVIWAILISCVMLLFRTNFVQLISGSSQQVVLDNASQYLMINAPFYSVLGILLNTRVTLQGLGKKIVPLISSVIELVGKLIFVVLLIPVLGYFGVIIVEPMIWCFMCIQLQYTFQKTIQKEYV